MTGSIEGPPASAPPVDHGTPLPRLTSLKWYYGIGSIAFGVKTSGGAYLLLYYNQVLGLSPSATGLAIGVAGFVDAFFDPIIGYVSDNFRSPWGRRHPFMYPVAIPAAIVYALLWNPPHLSPAGLIAYLFVAFVAARILLTLYEISSTALLPGVATLILGGYDITKKQHTENLANLAARRAA